MTANLQTDIIDIHNLLSKFSDDIVKVNYPLPIRVYYEVDWAAGKRGFLVFQLKGKTIKTQLPSFYCLDLLDLVDSYGYLLPEHYINLMYELETAIHSGKLLEERVLMTPEKYGFSIYKTDASTGVVNGPVLISSIKFISGNSWLFRKYIEYKYDFDKTNKKIELVDSKTATPDSYSIPSAKKTN